MNLEHESYSPAQQFLMAASQAGVLRRLINKPGADPYTIRNMHMTAISVFTGAPHREIAQAYGGINRHTVGQAIRQFMQNLWKQCPVEIQTRFPDADQLLYESLLSAHQKRTTTGLGTFQEYYEDPLASGLREATTKEEIRKLLDQVSISPYQRYTGMEPPLLYSIKSIATRCGFAFAPRKTTPLLTTLKEADIPVGKIERTVQTDKGKIRQRYFFIAAQYLELACQALGQNSDLKKLYKDL